MTDRHQGYIVTLTDDFREDDAEAIISAIRMVKGVASVTPVVADYEQWFSFESYPGQPSEERPWSHKRVEVRCRNGRSFFSDPYKIPSWLIVSGCVWRPAPKYSTAESANERTTISPTL